MMAAMISLIWQLAPIILGVASAGGAWLWVRRSGRQAERADMERRASIAAERARKVRERPMSRQDTIERMRQGKF